MNNPTLRYSVYDPKDLTVKQLLKILHIEDKHRVVDTGHEGIIVDWDAAMADERVIKRNG